MLPSILLAAVTAAASVLTPVTTTAAPTPAATPPMGWNDWAHYQCDFTEQTILSNADALMLKDIYGYTIALPENFGTFFATLQSNGTLLIRGGIGPEPIS